MSAPEHTPTLFALTGTLKCTDEHRPTQIDPDLIAKRDRLAKEFPKTCGCGIRYSCLGAFVMRTTPCSEINDAFARLILRDCACGSTLAAVIEIHDLSEE